MTIYLRSVIIYSIFGQDTASIVSLIWCIWIIIDSVLFNIQLISFYICLFYYSILYHFYLVIKVSQKLISGMANLREMDLSRCSKITDAGVQHLLSLPALEKLWISETGVTADGVTILASLPNLLLLDLGGLPVTDSALDSLQV